jgi:hypothetical protein
MGLSWEAISSLVISVTMLVMALLHRRKMPKGQAQSAGTSSATPTVDSRAVSFASRRSVLDGEAEAFELGGGVVAEDSGEQAHGGVEDDGGAEFSSREDVVADGEFAVGEEMVDALVDALVAAAEEDDAVEFG